MTSKIIIKEGITIKYNIVGDGHYLSFIKEGNILGLYFIAEGKCLNPLHLNMWSVYTKITKHIQLDKEKFKQIIDELECFRMKIASVLIGVKFVASNSEAKRLIQQHGVKVNNIIAKLDTIVKVGDIIQKGKLNYIKLV